MEVTGIYINDNSPSKDIIAKTILDLRKQEYNKLVKYEKENPGFHYLPMGIEKHKWESFRKSCSEKQLKEWFGIGLYE